MKTGESDCRRDLRLAEKALRESEAMYKSLVEDSIQGMVIAQGLPPRLVFASPKMDELSGYSVAELLSMPPGALKNAIHPDDQAEFFRNYRLRLTGKPAPQRAICRFLRKDGHSVWIEKLAVRIRYRGQPAVLATFIDITARKQAEEKLKDMCRALHDNIIQSLFALGLRIDSRRARTQDKTLRRKMAGYTADINNIIRDLREFVVWMSDSDNAGANPKKFAVELKSLIKRFRTHPGPAIRMELDSQACGALNGAQRSHILAVAQEAVSNAVHHAQARHVTIRLKARKKAALLEIEDDGRGFDPRATEGKGDGLRNILERAQALNGKLDIASTPGRGARIRLESPLDPGQSLKISPRIENDHECGKIES